MSEGPRGGRASGAGVSLDVACPRALAAGLSGPSGGVRPRAEPKRPGACRAGGRPSPGLPGSRRAAEASLASRSDLRRGRGWPSSRSRRDRGDSGGRRSGRPRGGGGSLARPLSGERSAGRPPPGTALGTPPREGCRPTAVPRLDGSERPSLCVSEIRIHAYRWELHSGRWGSATARSWSLALASAACPVSFPPLQRSLRLPGSPCRLPEPRQSGVSWPRPRSASAGPPTSASVLGAALRALPPPSSPFSRGYYVEFGA